VPAGWTEADERRVVAEVAALLPTRVQLELDGRYAAMLSHEPKNYALLPYGAPLILRGVAFRSSRAEPFGEAFLRRALDHLLAGDLASVQRVYIETVLALRKRQIPTRDVAARVRLTLTPAQYAATRTTRHQLSYEAVLASGRTDWAVGEHVRVYRATRGRSRLIVEPDEDAEEAAAGDAADGGDAADLAGTAGAGDPIERGIAYARDLGGRDAGDPRELAGTGGSAELRDPSDPRDYDIEHYLHVLRDTYAARLVRALSPDDFAAVFADPEQPSLFVRSLVGARPILTTLSEPDQDPEPIARALHG